MRKIAVIGIALILALALAGPAASVNSDNIRWDLTNKNVVVKVENESNATRTYRVVVFLTDQGGQFERQNSEKVTLAPDESVRLAFPYKDNDTKFRIKVTRDGEVLFSLSELLDSVFIPAQNKSDSVFE